jgi:hypothetical protein
VCVCVCVCVCVRVLNRRALCVSSHNKQSHPVSQTNPVMNKDTDTHHPRQCVPLCRTMAELPGPYCSERNANQISAQVPPATLPNFPPISNAPSFPEAGCWYQADHIWRFIAQLFRFVHALPICHDCHRLYQYTHTVGKPRKRAESPSPVKAPAHYRPASKIPRYI